MLVVLAYHSIDPISDYVYSTTPDMLKKQLRLLLDRKFKFIGADDFVDVYKSGSYLEKDYALVTFDDGYKNNFIEAYPILKELKIPAVIFLATDYIGKNFGGFPMLSWEEILEMHKEKLIDFGSHTLSHAYLDGLKTDVDIRNELEKSKTILQNILKEDVKSVAYPKGKINESVLKLASELYVFGFAGEGILKKKNNNILSVPRITVSKNINFFKFKMLFNNFYWCLRKVKQYFYDKYNNRYIQ